MSPASRSFRIRATSWTEITAQPARHLHEDRADDAAPEIEHQQQALRRHRHQLHPLQHQLVERRRDRHAELLGQHAQHLRGAPEHLLHRVARPHELGAQGLLRLAGGRGEPHDLVDVDPVGPVGRDPAGGGVGVKQVPLLLQVAHRVADGGGGDAQAVSAGDGLAPGRLRGLDVGLDDRLEHAELPVAQLFRRRHDVEIYRLTTRLGSAPGGPRARRAGATLPR